MHLNVIVLIWFCLVCSVHLYDWMWSLHICFMVVLKSYFVQMIGVDVADTAVRCWIKTLMTVVGNCCMSWFAFRIDCTTKIPWRWHSKYCCSYYYQYYYYYYYTTSQAERLNCVNGDMSFLWEFVTFLLFFSGTRLGVRRPNRSSRKMAQMTWIRV